MLYENRLVCGRACKGICGWLLVNVVYMNKCTRVWVLLFRSDALQPHNHHSPSQRFEHRVAESSQRQLEREWACAQVCALMFVTARYPLSSTANERVCWGCVYEWMSSYKGNMSGGFVASYHLSLALKKMISSDDHLQSKSCNMLLPFYENRCVTQSAISHKLQPAACFSPLFSVDQLTE